MDWVYIGQELEKLGISEFEEDLRLLSKKVFGDLRIATLGEEERENLEYFLFSGTYGTVENMVNNKINKLSEGKSVRQAKCIYFLRRIFPGKGVLQVYCPLAEKYKVLLLYAWIKRLVKGIVFRYKSIMNEMRYK